MRRAWSVPLILGKIPENWISPYSLPAQQSLRSQSGRPVLPARNGMLLAFGYPAGRGITVYPKRPKRLPAHGSPAAFAGAEDRRTSDGHQYAHRPSRTECAPVGIASACRGIAGGGGRSALARRSERPARFRRDTGVPRTGLRPRNAGCQRGFGGDLPRLRKVGGEPEDRLHFYRSCIGRLSCIGGKAAGRTVLFRPFCALGKSEAHVTKRICKTCAFLANRQIIHLQSREIFV